jgi:ankyrin repeat protein
VRVLGMADARMSWCDVCVARLAVEYLVSKGAKVDTVDDSGWSPLLSAASAGKTEAVAFVRPYSLVHTRRSLAVFSLHTFTSSS